MGNDEMKCPNCGNENYECFDDELDTSPENPIYTWYCYCPKCNHGFDIVATLVWTSVTCEDRGELEDEQA